MLSAASLAELEPPIPRLSTQHHSGSPRPRHERRRPVTPEPGPRPRKRSQNHVRLQSASPEVISSLINSLTTISLTAHNHFESLPAQGLDGTISHPATPPPIRTGFGSTMFDTDSERGSFGVTYGSQRSRRESDIILEHDDAAEPPVIRTSKPPSGFSSLTAPKATKRERDSSLKNYLRSASVSSLSLHSSRDRDDFGTIRTMSPENVRPRASNSSLPRSSVESKRSAPGHRSLAHMSSRGRMRSRETEWRRPTVAAKNTGARSATPERSSTPNFSAQPFHDRRLFLAESPIFEEPVVAGPSHLRTEGTPEGSAKRKGKRPLLNGETESPVIDSSVVPERGSSLRHAESPTPRKHRRRRSSGESSLQRTSVIEEDEAAEAPSIPRHNGSEDATTRRIMELRTQQDLRKTAAGGTSGIDVEGPVKRHRVAPSSESVLRQGSSNSSLSDIRPAPPNPAAKAHRTLGITPPSPVFSKRPHQMRIDGFDRTNGITATRDIDQTRENARNYLAELALECNDPMQMLGRFHANLSSGAYSKGATSQRISSKPTPTVFGGEPAAREGPARDPSNGRTAHPLPDSTVTRLSSDTVSPAALVPPNSPESSLQQAAQTVPSEDKPSRANSKKKRWSHPDLPLLADQKFNIRRASDTHALKMLNEPTLEERPSSADSIDQDVKLFLRAPRLSRKVRHPQTGRIISFSEVGDPQGFAVICCVGMGLTRYVMAFYDELAASLKLRLITPDRPGVGESESDPSGTPLSWPDDIQIICNSLGITKFSLLAHSAGAIYALATALRMPQHIRGRVHLLAPWIPPSQMSSIGLRPDAPPAGQLPKSQRFLRALPTSFLKVANSAFMSGTSAGISRSNSSTAVLAGQPANKRRRSLMLGRGLFESASAPSFSSATSTTTTTTIQKPAAEASNRDSMLQMDREIPTGSSLPNQPSSGTTTTTTALSVSELAHRRRLYDARLTLSIWALATHSANPAHDLLVCLERHRPIGFRYVDITRAVVVHHGSRDTRVPLENVKWLGRTMRRCEVRVLEGEGHGLMASAVVMGRVLEEVGREWGEWMEVVEGRGRRAGSEAVRE